MLTYYSEYYTLTIFEDYIRRLYSELYSGLYSGLYSRLYSRLYSNYILTTFLTSAIDRYYGYKFLYSAHNIGIIYFNILDDETTC